MSSCCKVSNSHVEVDVKGRGIRVFTSGGVLALCCCSIVLKRQKSNFVEM